MVRLLRPTGRGSDGQRGEEHAAEHVEGPGFEGHYGETEGYTVGFERYSEHADLTPLFVGLPDDMPVLALGRRPEGQARVPHAGGVEITDGEAYYVGPGHTPEIYPDTEVVEFSPTDELQRTMEVVTKNMEAQG